MHHRAHPLALLPAILWSLASLGCNSTPGTDKVCGRGLELDAKDRGGSPPEAERNALLDRCQQRLAAIRTRDTAAYERLAKCVLAASDVNAALACEESNNAKGQLLESRVAGAPQPGAGPLPGGCRDGCKKTFDACTAACGPDPECSGKCTAAFTKCGVDCVN